MQLVYYLFLGTGIASTFQEKNQVNWQESPRFAPKVTPSGNKLQYFRRKRDRSLVGNTFTFTNGFI